MARMNADYFGLCRTADGRNVPCSQPPGDGLAQLALMLRGSGMLNQGYSGNGIGPANNNLPAAANNQRPAYENSWAALADNLGQSAPDRHLPITKAQEIFIAPSQPYIDTIPWGPSLDPFPINPGAPEYIPYPPLIRPVPQIPDEISPIPFIGPNELKDDGKGYNRPRPSDEECGKQWAEASKICNDEQAKLVAQGIYGGFDMARCLKGLVSEDCGGNPVEHPKPKRRPPPLLA